MENDIPKFVLNMLKTAGLNEDEYESSEIKTNTNEKVYQICVSLKVTGYRRKTKKLTELGWKRSGYDTRISSSLRPRSSVKGQLLEYQHSVAILTYFMY